MNSWTKIVEKVQARAKSRCEYCKMHQALQGATFHVEHIVPSAHGGPTKLENLAFACPSCNLKKSDRVQAQDPKSMKVVSLYDPRQHQWDHHFQWQGYKINGISAIGRATVKALNLNHRRRLLIRKAEKKFGLFPS